MEYAIIPMVNLKITQGRFESPSHQTRNAYDIAGADTSIENFNAPFTARVVYVSSSSLVLVENVNQVKTPQGIFNPKTLLVSTFHDNDVSDLQVGQIISQGSPYVQEGTYGNATGNHVHMQIASGSYSGGYPLEETSPDVWDLKGTKINIEDAFYLQDGVNVLDDNGYAFVSLPEDEEELLNVKIKNYRFVLFRNKHTV